MKAFGSVLKFEIIGFFSSRYLLAVLLFFLVSIYAVFIGIGNIQSIKSRAIEFQDTQSLIFEKTSNYTEYSKNGEKILPLQSDISIFFSPPSIFDNIIARVNTIALLEINQPRKGPSALKKNILKNVRFSDVVFLFGSILALILGADAVRRKGYLKILTCSISARIVFLAVVISRFILLTVSLISVLSISLLIAILKGFSLSTSDIYTILTFILTTLIVLYISMTLGVLFGSMAKKKLTLSFLLISWFFMILSPWIFNGDYSDSIKSDNMLYRDKHSFVSLFEERVKEEAGRFEENKRDIYRQLTESYFKNELMKVVQEEENYRIKHQELAKSQILFSNLTPGGLYISTVEELSSFGYKGYTAFHGYLIQFHKEFLRFWVNRVYYFNPKELIRFVKEDENIFRSKSRLPYYYGMGIVVNCIYILILLFAAYFTFKRSLTRVNKKDMKLFQSFKPEIDSGDLKVWQTNDNILKNTLFNLCSGKTRELTQNGFPGKLIINGSDIVQSPYEGKFLYVCNPRDIPQYFKVKHFLNLFADLNRLSPGEKSAMMNRPEVSTVLNTRLKNLTPRESFQVMNSLFVINASIYIIDDIASIKAVENLFDMKDTIDRLIRSGSIVIYLSSIKPVNELQSVLKANNSFNAGNEWGPYVEVLRVQYNEMLRKDNGQDH